MDGPGVSVVIGFPLKGTAGACARLQSVPGPDEAFSSIALNRHFEDKTLFAGSC
jgi:hypothetical protein